MAYTDTERSDAVALYVEHGLAEAHRRTEVPKNTIKLWARKAGHDPSVISARASEKTAAATAARTIDMAAERALLRDELMLAARFHVQASMDATDGVDAKAWITAGAIALDKIRLELGEVTDRTEQVAPPERTPGQEAELAKVLPLLRAAS